MPGTAWIWIAIAAPLLVAGAVCIVRFVVGDRSRGRPRCPRCWYDMGGGQEKCPECGRAVRSERDLHRARRPKRWAVAGVGLLVLGGASLATRQAVVHGAVSLVPDWVLVAGMGRWPEGGELTTELDRRHYEGELSVSSQRRLIRKSAALLGSSETSRSLIPAMQAVITAEMSGEPEARRHWMPWCHWITVGEEADTREVALDLCEVMLRSSDEEVLKHARNALLALGEKSAIGFPLIVRRNLATPPNLPLAEGPAWSMLSVPQPPYGRLQSAFGWNVVDGDFELSADLVESVHRVSSAGDDPEHVREALREVLTTGSEESRLLAMWIIRASLWPDDELRVLALSRYDSDSELTAMATVDFAASGPLDEPALAVLRQALRSEHWKWTVDLVGARGDEAVSLGVDLRELLTTWRARDCVVSYASVTGDRAGAARVLLAIAEEKPRHWSSVLLEDFGRIGWSDERVVAFLSDHLTASDPLDRLHAATALLRLGAPKGSDKAELTRIVAEAMTAKYRSLSMTTAFTDAVRFGETDIPTVLDILGDCSTRGSGSVVRALGMAGTAAEEALPWLHEHADNQSSVNWEAEYAIRRIEWCLKHGDPPPAPRDER